MLCCFRTHNPADGWGGGVWTGTFHWNYIPLLPQKFFNLSDFFDLINYFFIQLELPLVLWIIANKLGLIIPYTVVALKSVSLTSCFVFLSVEINDSKNAACMSPFCPVDVPASEEETSRFTWLLQSTDPGNFFQTSQTNILSPHEQLQTVLKSVRVEHPAYKSLC